ncbi:MAG TPA: hypothetical protein VGB01_05770 [candidate division Zixibacteria bacterium]
MKAHKIGLNFKINPVKGKDISSSKALSRKEDDQRKTRNIRDLQPKSNTNQIRSETDKANNLTNVNKLKFSCSKQKTENRNFDNLKNPRRFMPSNLTHIDTGKTSASTLDIREEKIKEAKIRLAQGYYSRAKVYSKVAERIIDILI